MEETNDREQPPTMGGWKKLEEKNQEKSDCSERVLDDPIMKYFSYRHLPANLQEVSGPFCKLAESVVANLPRNAERTVALRKLLEAKDAAVRASLE